MATMVFMRFGWSQKTLYTYTMLKVSSLAWRVQPRNYLLFACHFTNATAQSIQDARFYNYWYNGGREKKLALAGNKEDDVTAPGKVTAAVIAAREEGKNAEK
ncbi:hypothetical protein C0992_005442 [Termitomyces sp. T32_za158]|nr:hypothetical protein C0992_005442 [Termitomyces sp. T32_za158]